MDRIINPDKPEDEEPEPSEGETRKFAWETLIHAVAKEFDTDWDEVFSWNFILFAHKCAFMKHKAWEELRMIRKNNPFKWR